MATAKYDEYLEVDSVPLDTPAWEVVNNYGWLYKPPAVDEFDYDVSARPGLQPAPVLRRSKRGPLQIQLNGDVDSDGDPTASLPAGLRDNVDELLTAIAPPQHTLTGTQTLRHVHPSEATRTADGRLTVVDLTFLAGNMAEVTVDCIILRGVTQSETVDSSSRDSITAEDTFTVTNPGTSFQENSEITLSGDATSVLIENLTWQADGNCNLEVEVDLGSGDVTIDTSDWTVTQAGVGDVHGNVTSGLHVVRSWLPLAPGDNTIQVTPTGGSVTVDWDHFPAFL